MPHESAADSGGALCDIAVSPVAVDFGERAVGEVATAPIWVSNAGLGNCEIGIYEGQSGGDVWVGLDAPEVVDGGATFEWSYTWAPTHAEALERTIRITTSDPYHPEILVPVTGTCPG